MKRKLLKTAERKMIFLTLAITIFPGALLAETEGHHPKLVVTPSNLNFFACAIEGRPIEAPEPKNLQIRGIFNAHEFDFERTFPERDTLKWYATPDQGWIKIEPVSGRTPDEATVRVDPSGLGVGELLGSIRFDTPGQRKPRIVQIKFRILTAAAGFTLEPPEVSFNGETSSNITLIDSVNLGVKGLDQLEFAATNSQSWLKVIPSQATAPITVFLLAATDSLQPGIYHDTVVFKARISDEEDEEQDDDYDDDREDNDCENRCGSGEISAFLPVLLTLTSAGEAALVVTPRRLGFAAIFGGPNPQPQIMLVSASGNINIPWTATQSESWLKLDPASGTATSVPQSVGVSADIAGLNPGLYTDTISFSSSQAGISDVKVPVFLQVFPPSELSDSVAIGDGMVDLTEPDFNRFSVPIFASNTQAVRAIALPLHFEDGHTSLDSVIFAGGRAEFADLKLFLRLAEQGDFLVLVGFVLAPALPPGEGIIGWLYFTTTGVLPQFADTLVIDSTSVPNATGDPRMPQTLSVSYVVLSGGNPLVLNPAFKKGTVLLRNFQTPTSADDYARDNRPKSFSLDQNFPNPFNPQTAIAFHLPERSEVRLEVFDLLGRSVVTLTGGSMGAGRHTVVWNGCDPSGRTVSSGIYLYRLKAGRFEEAKKMMFLK